MIYIEQRDDDRPVTNRALRAQLLAAYPKRYANDYDLYERFMPSLG